MSRAEALLGPVPDTRPSKKELRRMSQLVRESVRANVPRLLDRFNKGVQQQRGFPTDGGRIGGPDDTYCHPE